MNQLIASTDQLTPIARAKRKRGGEADDEDDAWDCLSHGVLSEGVPSEGSSNADVQAMGIPSEGSSKADVQAMSIRLWDILSQGVPPEGSSNADVQAMGIPSEGSSKADVQAMGIRLWDILSEGVPPEVSNPVVGCDCPLEPLARARAREIAEVINAGTQPLSNLSLMNAITEATEGSDGRCDWCSNGCDKCEMEVAEIASDVEEPTHEELPMKEIPLAGDHKAYNMRLNDDLEKLFLEKMKALRAAVALKRMPRKRDDLRELWSAHRDSFQINLGEQNSTQGQGVGDMPSRGALYLADSLETDLSKGETPPCLTDTDVEAFVRALHNDGKLHPASKLGVCFMPRERPAYREDNVKKIFKEIEGVFQQLESMYQAKGFPLAHELAQLICKSGNTCTFTVSEPDENKLHIKCHEDNRNFGPAASISVFEDKRDELNSGLFFDQAGSKVYAGPGMTVAHFHTREARHGVQSPMYGRRYSLSIYNGVQAELQARLKAAGAVFLCTAERNALKERFAALRDQYLSQSLLVP